MGSGRGTAVSWHTSILSSVPPHSKMLVLLTLLVPAIVSHLAYCNSLPKASLYRLSIPNSRSYFKAHSIIFLFCSELSNIFLLSESTRISFQWFQRPDVMYLWSHFLLLSPSLTICQPLATLTGLTRSRHILTSGSLYLLCPECSSHHGTAQHCEHIHFFKIFTQKSYSQVVFLYLWI